MQILPPLTVLTETFLRWPTLSFDAIEMKRFLHRNRQSRKEAFVVGTLFASFALLGSPFAADARNEGNEAKNLARMNCGAVIECTTPDGKAAEVATASDLNEGAAALIMDDDTLSCPLKEGQTTFVIKLPAAFVLDRFTFVNENAAAAGELRISISNDQFPAASDKWVEVDGDVTFTNKRLFNLSMVGIEARYVKLAFNVRLGRPHRCAWIETLKEEELRVPGIAAYYVIMLVDNGRLDRARSFLVDAKRAALLPEEEQLLAAATRKLLANESEGVANVAGPRRPDL